MPLEEVKRNIIGGKVKRISSSVQLALTRGYSAEEIINAMTESMLQVGALFHNNYIFVPEMLVAAATMKKGLALLRPLLSADRQTNHEKFILGTVQGDLHDVGKNLVCCTLESFGFEVIDLGVDVPPEVFVETVRKESECHLLGLSALLTTTIPAISETIQAVTEAGLREQVFIMVGGAPLTAEIAAELGADSYEPDAYATARAAVNYVEQCRLREQEAAREREAADKPAEDREQPQSPEMPEAPEDIPDETP